VIVALGLLMAASCRSAGGGTGVVKGTMVPGTASATTAPATTTAPPPPEPAAGGAPGPAPSTNPGVVVTPSGVVVPVVGQAAGGWTVRTPCGNERSLTAGTQVHQATVVLDPGHGGDERGAISPSGLAEADVNLAVARRARTDLEGQGISVMLTRTEDYRVELTPRAMIAKALAPRAFVSIHHNADPDGPWPRPGTETYYQQSSPDSKRLAGLIWEEVVQALGRYKVAWVADTDAGAKTRPGDHGDYYAMLREPAPVVSALAELAFVSNQPEADLLGRADVQAVEGDAVARAIVRYLRTSDPGSGFTTAYPRPPNPPPTGPEAPAPVCTDPAL
jgi:N-acetylmuramoyl-L-alanine amidase